MLWRHRAVMAAMGGAVLVLGVAGEASAQEYRQQSATFCMPITHNYAAVRSDSGAIGNGGSSAMRLVCPILDDSFLPKSSLNVVTADVFDGSTSAAVDARACVSFGGAVGGSCGPAVTSSSSGTGMVTLRVDPSVWARFEFDYGYLVFNLPTLSGSSVSSVHGWDLLSVPL